MPEMDGFELTKSIRFNERGSNRHMVIIAISADAGKGESERFRSVGMDDYLCKPLQLNDLANTLRRWHGPPELAAPSPATSTAAMLAAVMPMPGTAMPIPTASRPPPPIALRASGGLRRRPNSR